MTAILTSHTAGQQTLPFYERGYFRHKLSHGILHNRYGTKMCFMPSELMLALKQVLEEETGEAWVNILKRVGRIWGRRVARRFEKEITEYYSRPLHEIPVKELARILEGYFRYHGWGDLKLEFDRAEYGFIFARLQNSAFVEVTGRASMAVDSLVSGLLAEFFCQLSERTDIECIETECSAQGYPECRFVVGLASRLAIVERMTEEGASHEQIVQRICPNEVRVNNATKADTQKLDG